MSYVNKLILIYIGYVLIYPITITHAQKTGATFNRPEPMVFDLVDPLGAKKNELEINALFDYSSRTGFSEWSPEIEYSFMKGHAIEIELPIENKDLKEYKISLQGTLGMLLQGKMIHGWQTIGRRNNDDKTYGIEFLYLNDYKFNEKWSVMNMFGVRHLNIAQSREFIGLSNNSVFYMYSRNIILGLELNNEIRAHNFHYRLTPQIQYLINKNITLQLGGGPSQLNEKKITEWLITSRLIYDF